MVFFFQLLCTGYFAALMWTLYMVLSAPGPTNRPLLLWMGAVSALVVGLHVALGEPLGTTTEPIPTDKFFFLLKFSGMLVVLQVVNPWLRRTFARRIQRQGLPTAASEKLLSVNAFLANKALYVMIYVYQVLAIWVPNVA